MSQKPKRSFGIIIRRFFAGFLLFSIVMGLIEDITSGNFSRTTMDGFALGLIIVFFLAFYSRKKKVDQDLEEEFELPTVNTNYEDKEDFCTLDEEDIPNDDEDIEIMNLETQIDEVEIKTEDVNPPSGFNPVKDNEGIFSRLFKGRNNRYG